MPPLLKDVITWPQAQLILKIGLVVLLQIAAVNPVTPVTAVRFVTSVTSVSRFVSSNLVI